MAVIALILILTMATCYNPIGVNAKGDLITPENYPVMLNSGVSKIVAGTGINISPSGGTGNVTVNNVGVTSWKGLTGPITVVNGAGINVSNTGNIVTVANTGVTSAIAGTGIGVSGATGDVTFTNTGVTSAVAGSGINVSGATGAVTISSTLTTTSTSGTLTFAATNGVSGSTSTNYYLQTVGNLKSLAVQGFTVATSGGLNFNYFQATSIPAALQPTINNSFYNAATPANAAFNTFYVFDQTGSNWYVCSAFVQGSAIYITARSTDSLSTGATFRIPSFVLNYY